MRRSSSPCAKTSRWFCAVQHRSDPLLITRMRSQYSESSATFCSMTTTVTLSSRTLRSVSKTRVDDAGSSAAVGSSSTRTRGCMARMAAMATFCFPAARERGYLAFAQVGDAHGLERLGNALLELLVVGDAEVLQGRRASRPRPPRPHHLGVDVLQERLPTICEMSVSVTSQVSCPSTSVAP